MNVDLNVAKINHLIGKAKKLQLDEDYINAYDRWDDVIRELNSLMQETANKRKLSKLVGWGAAFFTGGLGPTDLILVPGINKLLLKWFNIDLDFISGKLSLAVRQRQVCLYHEDKLAKISHFLEELTYFSYSYSLEEKKFAMAMIRSICLLS